MGPMVMPMGRGVAISAIALSMAASALPAAELAGRVRITRSLTPKKVSLNQVYERSVALPAPPAATPSLAEELGRVVVYLEGNLPEPVPVTAELNQTQRRFQPEVVALPAGSTVVFPNSDPIFHNVFSLSRPYSTWGTIRASPSCGSTNQTYNPLPPAPEYDAYIVVTPNRFYARPDSEGRFHIDGAARPLYGGGLAQSGASFAADQLKESTQPFSTLEIPGGTSAR
jgi:plastocyanin